MVIRIVSIWNEKEFDKMMKKELDLWTNTNQKKIRKILKPGS